MSFPRIKTIIRSQAMSESASSRNSFFCPPVLWLMLCCASLLAQSTYGQSDQSQPDFGACDSRIWIVGASASGRTALMPVDHDGPEIDLHPAGDPGAEIQISAPAFHHGERQVFGIGAGSDGRFQLLRVHGDGAVTAEASLNGVVADWQPAAGAIDLDDNYFVAAGNSKALYRINLNDGEVHKLPMDRSLLLSGLTWYDGRLYGLTGDRKVVILDSSEPEGPLSITPLLGADSDLDLRGLFSATEGVYGYDAEGRVYRLHAETGVASQVALWGPVTNGMPVRCVQSPFQATSPGQRFHMSRKSHVEGEVGSQRMPSADIYLELQDDDSSFTAGGVQRYSLTVGSNSPGRVENLPVTVPVPAGVTRVAWRCVAEAGARCEVASGTGPIDTLVHLDGGTVRFIIEQQIAEQLVGSVTTTVSAAPPAGTVDPNPSNNNIRHTNTRALQEDFGRCDSRVFIHQGAGTTNLLLLEPGSGATTFIGNSPNVQYNAAAYNPDDNYIYAISSDYSLIRISSDGTSEVVRINIVPAADWVAGTFASDGYMYVTTSGAIQNVYRIDVTLQDPFVSQQLLFDTTQVTSSGDLAFYNGRMYTVDTGNNQLRSYDVVGQPNGAVLSVTKIGNGYSGAPVTSMWSGTNGVFGADDAGNVYQFDLTTGVPTRVGSAPTSSVSDGSHCNEAPFELSTDLGIFKSALDFNQYYKPTGEVTYQVLVYNNGPTPVQDAVVSDPLPAGITDATWTCSANGLASCGAASGSGDLLDTPDLQVNGQVTYLITIQIPRDFTGDLTNTATVEPPEGIVDSNPDDNTSTYNQQRIPLVQFEKVSIGGVGGFGFQTTNVQDGGPYLVTQQEGVPVQSGLYPAINPGQPITITENAINDPSFSLTDISCTGMSPGGNATVDLNARNVTFDSAATQPGADIFCTFTNESQQATLTIEKISIGGVGSFSFSVSNAGGSPNITTVEEGVAVQAPTQTIVNPGQQVSVSEPTLPDGFTLTDISCTGLSDGGSADVDLDGRRVTIDGAGTQLGADIICTFTNTATPPASITLQKALPNGRFVDSDQFDLTISGAGGTSATTQGSGSQVSPVISATNPVVGQSYTLSEAGNGSTNLGNYATSYACTNALSGGQMPSGDGSSFSFTLNQGDQLSCTFTNTPLDRQADLAVTKTDNSDIYTPGSDVTYQIVVSNNGPDDVSEATLTDALPSAISNASWTCSAAGGASCGAASGSGAINDMPDIPVGGNVTYTFTLSVPADYSGSLANTATVAVPDGFVDPNPDNNAATDIDQRAPAVTIEKITEGDVGTFGFSGNNGIPSLDLTTVSEGVAVDSQLIYLLSADTETTITEGSIPDTFELSAISCTGLGSGGTASVDLSGGSVTLDAAAIAPNTDIVCTFTNTRLATDLAVTKTAPVDTVQTGDQVTYTLTVDNLGPNDTTNAVLTDTPDNNQNCAAPDSVTCSASGGAQCPAPPIDVNALLGSGVIIPSLPANSEVIFTVVCDVTGTGNP